MQYSDRIATKTLQVVGLKKILPTLTDDSGAIVFVGNDPEYDNLVNAIEANQARGLPMATAGQPNPDVTKYLGTRDVLDPLNKAGKITVWVTDADIKFFDSLEYLKTFSGDEASGNR